MQRPDDVDARVVIRTLDRHAHVRLRSEMERHLRANLVEDAIGVRAYVPLVHARARGNVLPLAGREVVEHVHVVPARE